MWPNIDRMSEKHPDFNGSLDVDGTKYWVSGWRKKEGANPAAPIITFTIKVKENSWETTQKSAHKPATPGDCELDDDLPF
jgi:hypothetical protein